MTIQRRILGIAAFLFVINADATPVYGELSSAGSQFYTAEWFYNNTNCEPGEPCVAVASGSIFRVDDSTLDGEILGSGLNSINGELSLRSASDFAVNVDIVGGSLTAGEPWYLDFYLRQTDTMGTLLFENLPQRRPQSQSDQMQFVLIGSQMQPYLVTATGLNSAVSMFEPFLGSQLRSPDPVDVPTPASLLLLAGGLLLQICGSALRARRRQSLQV